MRLEAFPTSKGEFKLFRVFIRVDSREFLLSQKNLKLKNYENYDSRNYVS